MSKFTAWIIAGVVSIWVTYASWMTGYQVGYDDGSVEAWNSARQAFMPPAQSRIDLKLTDARLSDRQTPAER